MRHAVLGVGGVGGLMAVSLARCGEEVTLILRPESIDKFPRTLHVESPFGVMDYALPRSVLIDFPVDFLWLAVKAPQLDDALMRIIPGTEIGSVVPLLNGIGHIPFLRQRYGDQTVIPATIEVESELLSPGRVCHRTSFANLNFSETGRKRLAPLLPKLAHIGFKYRFFSDEVTMLWRKLSFLGPIALTTAASGLNVGELRTDAKWHRALLDCAAEYCLAAVESGADISEKKVFAFLDRIPAELRTSMQKDVAAGRMPEIDAIAGPVIRASEAHGFSSAATREMISLIQKAMIDYI